MKEPKVHVGILFEPQIEFILLNPYRINGQALNRRRPAPKIRKCFFMGVIY